MQINQKVTIHLKRKEGTQLLQGTIHKLTTHGAYVCIQGEDTAHEWFPFSVIF